MGSRGRLPRVDRGPVNSLLTLWASKTCGGRLWRAFKDPPETSFEPLIRNLDLRREHRQECQCFGNGHALQQ